MGDGGEDADLEGVRGGVVDAVLDRAEGRRGADVPANLVESLDDAGVDHVVGVGLQIRPRVELVGDARGGQLLKHHRAIGGVACVFARPERGGSGDGLQVAEAGGQGGLEGQDLCAVFDADVDMHAVQQHLVSPVGGAFDQLRVAGRVGDALAAGSREGVGAGGSQVDAQVGGQGRQVVDALREVGEAFGDGGARLGDHLDRVEQHLAVDAGVELPIGRGAVDDGVRALAQVVGVAVYELELPLDADS